MVSILNVEAETRSNTGVSQSGNSILAFDAGVMQTTVLQPGPEGQDLWITSYYSYEDNYGVDNDFLKVGGVVR